MQSSTEYKNLIQPFWGMPSGQLQHTIDLLGDLLHLRKRWGSGELESPPPSDAVRSLPKRKPLKEPKPGSLRAIVRDVLIREGKPMGRGEIIEAVAELKGMVVDTSLQVKVGDVLNHPHDPFFIKIRRGVYAAR